MTNRETRALRDRVVAAIRTAPFKELRAVDGVNGPLQITALVDDLADAVVRAVSVPPPAPRADDQAALRDRIRRAVCEAEGFMWNTELLEPDEYGDVADAVLAVLPAPADQAAVRAAAFDEAAEKLAGLDPVKAALAGQHAWNDAAGIVQHMARQERRMADEAQQPEPEAEPTAEEIARANVLALHQIGEQLAGIESWMWEHLADVRETAKAQPERPRCPDCQMPHDLTPSMELACASIRASIADHHAAVSGPVAGEQQNETPEAEAQQAPIRCTASHLRVHHAPHGWEPQPGMEPIPCPGYPQPGKEA